MAWAPDYVIPDELKAYLRIGDAVDDVQIGLAITAASRAVDRCTNRQFGLVAAPEPRKYTAFTARLSGQWRWVVEIDDLMTVAGLVVTTAAGTITSFDLQPSNAAVKGEPWTRLVVTPSSSILPTSAEDGVTVEAKWGWTTVPAPVEQATLLQASRLFKRRDAPFGVAGSPELGSELRLLAKVDPDVEVVLGPYKRWWAAA